MKIPDRSDPEQESYDLKKRIIRSEKKGSYDPKQRIIRPETKDHTIRNKGSYDPELQPADSRTTDNFNSFVYYITYQVSSIYTKTRYDIR